MFSGFSVISKAISPVDDKSSPAAIGYSKGPSYDFIPALDGLRAVSILLVILLRSLLSSRPARAIGRWSYSLYLWHWLVLIGVLRLMPEDLRELAHQGGLPLGPWLAFALPVIVLSVVAAAASYNFVERPILALRRRFGSHTVSSTA